MAMALAMSKATVVDAACGHQVFMLGSCLRLRAVAPFRPGKRFTHVNERASERANVCVRCFTETTQKRIAV